MSYLAEFLNKAKQTRLKIAVVGDSMVDEYYAVRVHRISPEFPIPVLLSPDDKPINVVPGGAANVCCQMKHWNADVYLVSAFDTYHANDWNYSKDLNATYSITVDKWNMPKKKRLYDGDFPLDRWDVEQKKESVQTSAWSDARCRLMELFASMVRNVHPDVVIISDYSKGIFVNGGENISQPIIQLCNKYNIPTIVDPKSTTPYFWQGCTILKPNADWARGFCDKHDLECRSKDLTEESEFIQKTIGCKSVVITDSGSGVCVYNDEEAHFFPAPTLSQRRPVIRSVIGAGDSFCAFFAMAEGLKMELGAAVQVAFNGASAYIEDKHNSPVTPYRFHKWFDPIEAKKVSLEELLVIKSQLDQSWVWSNGCYDIIHFGHLKTFNEAKKLGDKLVVGLNTDESVKRLKGKSRPINSYKNRENQLASLQDVDFVVPIPDEKPTEIIKAFMPDKIVKGADYKTKDIAGAEIIGEDNVYLVPLVPEMSTTRIINKVKNELCGEYVWTPGRALVLAEEGQIEYFYRFEQDETMLCGGGQVIRTVCGGLRRQEDCRPLGYVCDLKYLKEFAVFTNPERYA